MDKGLEFALVILIKYLRGVATEADDMASVLSDILAEEKERESHETPKK